MEDPSSLVRTAGTRAIYRQELKKRGLPEDSLSGATALFLAVGWELANGRALSDAQTAAIYRQTASGLRQSPLARKSGPEPVSYTHLDVYKRQLQHRPAEPGSIACNLRARSLSRFLGKKNAR